MKCRNCNALAVEHAKFCHECGFSLRGGAPTVERRLVSVLFADLVGFTAMAAARDPEDVRETLSRYFDVASAIIARHGGLVEKFIGDAVMAVWGTPTAREDDAERAVRAALELVASIGALSDGELILQLRAGVVTGNAAVTIGARNQGMVAGDTVNTASRLQSVAMPGTVLVDDVTQRATERAITYDDAGTRDLKGKDEPVHTWRATGIAGTGNAIEPPFVERGAEMARLREAFDACLEADRPQMVAVIGQRGIGKSRLVEEFCRYVDLSPAEPVIVRARASAYEQAAMGPLREIVRELAGIGGDGPAVEAQDQFATLLDATIADAGIRTRALQVLSIFAGVSVGESASSPAEVMPLLRAVFEGQARRSPLVVVLDDLQWADPGTLDFLLHLMQWGRDVHILVVTTARPEVKLESGQWLADTHAQEVHLAGIGENGIGQILDRLIPGMDPSLRTRLVALSDGVPLFAAETLRMLLATGTLAYTGDGFAVTSDVSTIAIPETLQSLLAARLDALTPDSLEVVLAASVAGETVESDMLGALTGLDPGELRSRVTEAVRYQVLNEESAGAAGHRYGFEQQLLRRAAYDRLSKAKRGRLHHAAAQHLEMAAADPQAIAWHYLQTHQLQPGTVESRVVAHWSTRAADESAALGASRAALDYYEHALAVEGESPAIAHLLEKSARMLEYLGADAEAFARYEKATHLYEQLGSLNAVARTLSASAIVALHLGHLQNGMAVLEAAFERLRDQTPEAIAPVARRLALLYERLGRLRDATRLVDAALEAAEIYGPADELDLSLVTRGSILGAQGRVVESVAILRLALSRALAEGRVLAGWAAAQFLSQVCLERDNYVDAIASARQTLELATALGDSGRVASATGRLADCFFFSGDWAQASTVASEDVFAGVGGYAAGTCAPLLARIAAYQGRDEDAQVHLREIAHYMETDDPQLHAVYAAGEAILAYTTGDFPRCAVAAQQVVLNSTDYGDLKILGDGIALLGMAAVACGDGKALDDILTSIDTLAPGRHTAAIAAHRQRFEAHRAALGGDIHAGLEGLSAALARFRELGPQFEVALIGDELLAMSQRRDELADVEREVATIFARLGTRSNLRRGTSVI